jgi:hypothetical protein
MPYISKTPKPPYSAVVFTSINADVDHTEHVEMYARLVQRASTYEGYLGIEPAAIATARGWRLSISRTRSRSEPGRGIPSTR